MADKEIAHIEERKTLSGGGAFAIIMLVLGTLVMILSLGDNSAIRGTMYAAMWTGWNVLWGACLVNGNRRSYVVFRRD